MTVLEFLSDRLGRLVLWGSCTALAAGILLATGTSPGVLILLLAALFLVFLAAQAQAFRRMRRTIETWERLLEGLDQKYLFPECAPKPQRLYERKLLDITRRSGQAMIGAVSEAQAAQRDYREYVERWVHEIKTPIAIIQADTEVLALETGEENEWIVDIQTQIKRLSTLTNDLIYLSRMEEEQGRQQFLPLPFSELVAEAAQAFQAVAKRQNKTLSVDVQPMLTLVGEEKSLVQLVSILLDNALKYSPEGGQIALRLSRQGKHLRLSVENTAEVLSKELLENMFDRFYRGDASRNSGQGGYGIGLSIAKAVVQAHRGKLSAAAKGTDRLVITALFPSA